MFMVPGARAGGAADRGWSDASRLPAWPPSACQGSARKARAHTAIGPDSAMARAPDGSARRGPGHGTPGQRGQAAGTPSELQVSS